MGLEDGRRQSQEASRQLRVRQHGIPRSSFHHGADPDHSEDEQRWITFGISSWAVFSPFRIWKKNNSKLKDTLRREYKRADFPSGFVRGKYAERAASSNIVVLEPEVASAFPDSASVNNALRMIVKVARQVQP